MFNRAIILDRDGTINIEKHYLYKKEDLEYTNKAPQAIKKLKDSGYKIIVITNQAGVARGYYAEDDVISLHNFINEQLREFGTSIDGFYYCPHHPEAKISDYRSNCKCRKPGTGLFEKAINDFNIDIKNSYVIGDKESDLIPAKELGFKTVIVMTGYGAVESQNCNIYDMKEVNLWTAAERITNI